MSGCTPNSFFLLDNRRYPALDGLRALATLMIFNVHFFAQYADKDYFLQSGTLGYHLVRVIHSGSLGVDILFLLSGCLTYLSVARNQGMTGHGFMIQRFKRLLPVILAVNLPALCWGASSVNWRQVVDNVFFLKLFPETTLVSYITWALVYEMWFYLFFAVFFIVLACWRFFRGWLFFLLLNAALLANILWLNLFSPFNDPRFLSFMAGILLARLMLEDRLRTRLDRIARWAGPPGLAAIFVMSWMWSSPEVIGVMGGSVAARLAFHLAFAAAAAALFWRLLSPGLLQSLLASTPLRVVGVVSYSLFMIHAQWGLPIGNTLPGGVSSFAGLAWAWVVSFGVSAVVAVLLYALLERPYFGRP